MNPFMLKLRMLNEIWILILETKSGSKIGVDFWGQPGHVPPIIEKRPGIYQLLPHFSHKNVGLLSIFLTSLCQWVLHLRKTKFEFFSHFRQGNYIKITNCQIKIIHMFV